jgi:hypothetical protein
MQQEEQTIWQKGILQIPSQPESKFGYQTMSGTQLKQPSQ